MANLAKNGATQRSPFAGIYHDSSVRNDNYLPLCTVKTKIWKMKTCKAVKEHLHQALDTEHRHTAIE